MSNQNTPTTTTNTTKTPKAQGATSAPPAEQDPALDPARATEKIRKQNQENASLRAAKKAAEDEAAAAGNRAKELEATAARVPDLETRLLRTEIALEFGLPASLAKRLLGSTREEILADAEQLLADVAPKPAARSTRPVESLQPGSGRQKDAPTIDEQIAEAQKRGDWRAVVSLQNSKLAKPS